MDSLADELGRDLKTIDTQVTGVVRTSWTGLSSGAYAESFWKWFEGAKDVYTGLAEMATLLDTAAGGYQGHDHQSAVVLSTQMNIDG